MSKFQFSIKLRQNRIILDFPGHRTCLHCAWGKNLEEHALCTRQTHATIARRSTHVCSHARMLPTAIQFIFEKPFFFLCFEYTRLDGVSIPHADLIHGLDPHPVRPIPSLNRSSWPELTGSSWPGPVQPDQPHRPQSVWADRFSLTKLGRFGPLSSFIWWVTGQLGSRAILMG